MCQPETFPKFHPGVFTGRLISERAFAMLERPHRSCVLPPRCPPPGAQMRWESRPRLKTGNSLCHPPLSRRLPPGRAAAPAPVPDQSKICWFRRWCSWYCLVCSLSHTGPSRYLAAKDTKCGEKRRHLFKEKTENHWLWPLFFFHRSLPLEGVETFKNIWNIFWAYDDELLENKTSNDWEHRVPRRKFDLGENRPVVLHIFVPFCLSKKLLQAELNR